jgi:16S rRNA (uracil1498-N3)-methyltransferase
MALRRVFVEWIRDGGAGVSGARAHHLARVARLRPGETVEISDQHHLFLAKATSISGRRVDFEIVEPLPAPAQPFPIILQTAIFQFARFEWIVEKASELGVRSIVPVCAALSERGLIQAARNRRSRWQKIAEEGAQQARRLTAPSVEEPVAFEEVLGAASGPLRFFLDTGSTPLKDFLEPAHKRGAGDHPAYLLVGPEGGWTDGERQQAQAAGYRSAALNTGVLRAETAALTAVAIASHLLGRQPEPEMPGSGEAAGL